MEATLSPSEIEFFIETMKGYELADIGDMRWINWHERLQKLHQQAIIDVSLIKEELVKETLISLNKTTVLVHEAISINVWKNKILPLLLHFEPNPETTFIAYTILFHEGICVGLLELILYHPMGSASLGDAAADLLDYAYDNVTQLLVIEHKEEDYNETGRKELLRQKNDIAFNIGTRCVSIIRYLAEHMDGVSIGIVSRIYTVHDIPILFVELLIKKPWLNDGKVYKKGNWVPNNSETLNQLEGQVWLCLRHLLLDRACYEYYQITDIRKRQLVKLIPMLTPTILDQIAPLLELNHWLCQLSISNLPSGQPRPILLETILEVKNGILKACNGKWKKIAKKQLDVVFCKDKNILYNMAQTLTAAYNTDLLEKFETSTNNICPMCDKQAVQRCSRCKKIWYCSRSCQVQDWNNHKEFCNDQ